MKCKVCGVEMFRDSVETGEDYKTYHYKCPNRKCSNYGYGGKAEKPAEDKKEE